jgi:hypothetical protein
MSIFSKLFGRGPKQPPAVAKPISAVPPTEQSSPVPHPGQISIVAPPLSSVKTSSDPQAGIPRIFAVPGPSVARSDSTPKDADGQPVIRALNESRRLDRATHELIGLLKGILAGGKVTRADVEELGRWLLRNREAAGVWPVSKVADGVSEAINAGITKHACARLQDLFIQVTGESEKAHLTDNPSTLLPLTRPLPLVIFAGRLFVFTGKFLYGSRHACESAVEQLGGICADNPTRSTDYLVIGTLGSMDWRHSTHGRKIEQAVEIAKKRNLAIISEDYWARCIDTATRDPQ